jgi:hypothetical protein
MPRKRRKGGIIWVFRPPQPLSPHQGRRTAEYSLILEVCVWLCESWAGRAEQDADATEAPIAMLLAVTRWFCRLDLPDSRVELFHGPPVLASAPGARW